jgi:hypothetical protein
MRHMFPRASVTLLQSFARFDEIFTGARISYNPACQIKHLLYRDFFAP